MDDLIPILAILMVFGIPMLAIWTKHREKIMERQLGATAQASAEKAAQYASRITEMADRIRVLERIVTDGGYDVATQIEALRDQRRVEQHLEDKSEIQ